EGAPRVAIINETMAARWFPGEDPVGRRITFFTADTVNWREIVGVVRDVRNDGLARAPKIEVYVPFAQSPTPGANFVVRTSADPLAFSPGVQRAVHEIDPSQPLFGVTTMQALIDATLSRERFSSLVLGVFSIVALMLAVIGIYGVIAYLVAQQSH